MPQHQVKWPRVLLWTFVGAVLGGLAGGAVGSLVALVGAFTMTPTADGGSNIVAFAMMAVGVGTLIGVLGGALLGVRFAMRRPAGAPDDPDRRT